MTRAKKLKKVIRARARKTGESYASARRQVLATRTKRAAADAPVAAVGVVAHPKAPATSPGRVNTRGGLSDAKSIERTGHGLAHWFKVLDDFGAPEKGHTAAARHLSVDHGVSSWYCQGVTVAYERARGLRAVHQTCDGRFQVSVSRVVPASVAGVVEALRSKTKRAAWLKAVDPELASALRAALDGAKGQGLALRAKGDARLRYKWGKSTVVIQIDPRGEGKAQIVAANEDLPAADLVESRRGAWKAALDRLREGLTSR